MRTCTTCNKDFFLSAGFEKRIGRQGNVTFRYECKTCRNHKKTIRENRKKKELIVYKGGKCSICDYNTYAGSLDFHHLHESEKSFSIGKNRDKSIPILKKEVDKTILLCSNCHREVHGGMHTSFIREEKEKNEHKTRLPQNS
jgi:hypothetical protein